MTTTALEPGQVTHLKLSALTADPDQPRKVFDQAGLESLASSLQLGCKVPILVRLPLKRGKFIIHDGERRYRAAVIAKLETLPALLVDEASEMELRAGQLTVNNAREYLKPMEVARVLAKMRKDDFATLNELSVFLDKSGLPAMNKHQIGALIALVDLPEWAQKMVEDGQVEASAIRKIKAALPYKNALDELQQELVQLIGWGGRLTEQDVVGALCETFRAVGKDLGDINIWSMEPVLFDPKIVCKGCEHLIKLDGEIYCMDTQGFLKKNADAKAAGLGPGGAKPEKPGNEQKAAETDETAKQEQRSRTLGQKGQVYLHNYLVNHIVSRMRREDSDQIDITEPLLAWEALGRPGELFQQHRMGGPVEGVGESEITSLEDLLKAPSLAAANLHAAVQVAIRLAWRETQVICHELWGPEIEKVWVLDAEFLKLFRKAELVLLATTHELEAPDGKKWESMKLGEIRTAIMDSTDQVRSPKVLQDIYTNVEAPRVPYVYRQSEGE